MQGNQVTLNVFVDDMKCLAVLCLSLFIYGVHSQSYEFIDEKRYIYNPPQVIPCPIDTTPCPRPYFQPYLPPVELTYEVPNYLPQLIDLRPPCQNYPPQVDIRPPCQCQSCLPQVDIRPPCPNYLPQAIDIYPPYQNFLPQVDLIPPCQCQNCLPQVDLRPPCQCQNDIRPPCQCQNDIRPPCQCQNCLPQVVDIYPPFQNFVPQPIDIRPPCPCQTCLPQVIDIQPPCQNYLPQVVDFVPPCQNFLPQPIDIFPPCQNYLPPVVDIIPPCQCGYPTTECIKQTIETSYPVDYITPYQYFPQVETVTQTIEICTEPVDIPCPCSKPKPSCPCSKPKPCSCCCQPPTLSSLIPYIETTLEDNSLSNTLANVLQTLIVSKLLARQTQPSCEIIRPCDLYEYITYDPSYRCPCNECQYPQYFAPGPVYPPYYF